MRDMSLWDDELVYGDDTRQGGLQTSLAYLLEKHAFAKKNTSLMNLCITDTSDVLPLASRTYGVNQGTQEDPIFKFHVTYNQLSSSGTGRTRREAREMASLQMLRLLYPGTWTFGELCDFLIPPLVPPDPWQQDPARRGGRCAKSARLNRSSSVYR